MTVVVYLFLLMSMEPAPTLMFVDRFQNTKECEASVKAYAKENKLTPEQEGRFMCMPVITSKLSDPL